MSEHKANHSSDQTLDQDFKACYVSVLVIAVKALCVQVACPYVRLSPCPSHSGEHDIYIRLA